MEDAQTSFDSERLDARFERVTRSLGDSAQDAEHLHRLASVGTVAGLIAHEFRNLMTPVKSYAQLALRRPEDAKLTQRALEAAMQGAEQAVAIAESLLELTGASGSAVGASLERCHVEHAVDGARAVVEGLLEERGVVFEAEMEPGLRAGIQESDLRQVLMNLFQNAARSMERGGVVRVIGRMVDEGWSLEDELSGGVVGSPSGEVSWRIEGEASCLSDVGDAGRVVIEVIDQGCGIAEGVLGRVFEPFVSGAGGRGMGLATCRALVGKAGGRVGVSSGVGAGTRFVIEFAA